MLKHVSETQFPFCFMRKIQRKRNLRQMLNPHHTKVANTALSMRLFATPPGPHAAQRTPCPLLVTF